MVRGILLQRLGAPLAASLLAGGLVTLSAASVAAQAPPDTVLTPAAIALGDSVFHGRKAGGLCFTCHGATAKGAPGLGPNLTDARWIHGDGSYAFILGIVEKGVPKPKESAVPMLPRGGANLNPAQLRAVAAYVYTLSKRP